MICLARHGTPQVPNDLAQHNSIGTRQGDEAYGLWRLSSGKRSETVKVAAFTFATPPH